MSPVAPEKASECCDTVTGGATGLANNLRQTLHRSLDDILPLDTTNHDVISRANDDFSRWGSDRMTPDSDSDSRSEGTTQPAAARHPRFSVSKLREWLWPRKSATSATVYVSSSSQHSSSDSDMYGFGVGRMTTSQLASVWSKPPAPLPTAAQQTQSDSKGSTLSPVSGSYYSSPRDTQHELSNLLIAAMRHDEQVYRCHCGLQSDEAELPRGWKMHLSTEPETAGMVFFTSPDNRTSWNLPLEVIIELDPEQQDRIRSLLKASGRRPPGKRRNSATSSDSVDCSPQTLQPRNYSNVPVPSSLEPFVDGIQHALCQVNGCVALPDHQHHTIHDRMMSDSQSTGSLSANEQSVDLSSDITSEQSASSEGESRNSVRMSKIYYV